MQHILQIQMPLFLTAILKNAQHYGMLFQICQILKQGKVLKFLAIHMKYRTNIKDCCGKVLISFIIIKL